MTKMRGTMKKRKLDDLRKEINGIDQKIIELLGRRGNITHAIGNVKKAKKQPIYSSERECLVYKNIVSKNKGPLSDDSLKAIYREVMSACLSLEHPIVVAYLGPEMTFTHQVSMEKFGSSVKYLSCDSITDVFKEVEKGNADYGVVPIENSIEGAVSHTMDMFVNSPLLICSEVYLRISHSLLSRAKSMNSIKKIYSKPEVFGQCRAWLEAHLASARLVEAASTAKAAEIVSHHSDSACIASEMAAPCYQLNVLARAIEDLADNTTRFLVIGKNMGKVTGRDKTSLVFSVKDRPGVLHDMLNAFKKRGINLTKIESRPSKLKAWKYYFFLDMDGHCEDKKVKGALMELQRKCNFMKILGSYPKG